MSVELVKDLLRQEKAMARAAAQVVARGAREVPESAPGIKHGSSSSVLKTRSKAHLDEAEVSKDLVRVKGHLDVTAIYLADSDDGSLRIHRQEFSRIDFMKDIDVEGITPDMTPRVELSVESLQFAVKASRRAEIEAVVDMTITGIVAERLEVGVDLRGESRDSLSLSTEQVRVEDFIGECSADCKVSLVKALPDRRPPVRAGEYSIIDVFVDTRIADATALDDGVRIEGDLDATVLYIADPDHTDPSYPVYSAVYRGLEWSQTIDMAGAIPHCDVYPKVTVVQAKAMRSSGDFIQLDIDLKIDARVVDKKEVSVVVDAESLDNNLIDMERQEIRVYETIGEDRAETMVSGSAELPEGLPPIYSGEQPGILATKVESRIVSANSSDQKVLVEGYIDIDMAYAEEMTLNEDMGPSHDTNGVRYTEFRSIPFEASVSVPEAAPGMLAEVDVTVSDVDIEPRGDSQSIDYSVALSLRAKVTEMKVLSSIRNCEVVGRVERDPALITFYIVQPGDTLWKIARRYNVTVDSLIRANGIEDPDALVSGQKVLIGSI